MDKIAQDSQYRQRMMAYSEHHGVEETANRYHVCRKTVWKWSKRWDGTAKSLEEKSRRPKSSPRKQKPWEIELVKRMRKKYGEDLLLGYQKAREKGYKRSYGCFKRTAEKEIPLKKKAPKRKNKPYQRASYPGQKVQIDVKYVPSYCVADGRKYYQYTAKDECTRWTYREMYEEHNTYSSQQFLLSLVEHAPFMIRAKDECTRWTYREMYEEHSTYSSQQFLLSLVEHAPFMIREVQTDNGSEFTKRLMSNDPNDKTLFEQELERMGIIYHRIRPATPRHNGKVERQHRIDEMRFYRHMRMYSLEDGRRQLARYQRQSNNIIMTCLGMRSPNQVLQLYLDAM